MWGYLSSALAVAVKLAVVVAINISLFVIVPVSNSFLQMLKGESKKVVTERRIIAQIERPRQQEKKVEPKSRLRTVSETSTQQPTQTAMKFKFSPDLSVEGGSGGVGIATQELEAEVFEDGEVDEDVVSIATPQPDYPERAKQMAIEGTVVVTFVVGADGKVASIESIEAPHPSFSRSIRETLKKWKFTPAKNKGIPVKKRVRVALDFALDQ